jgi:hypothetical protein
MRLPLKKMRYVVCADVAARGGGRRKETFGKNNEEKKIGADVGVRGGGRWQETFGDYQRAK